MMFGSLSLRDRILACVLAVLALYALAGAAWVLRQEMAWKKAAKAYQTTLKQCTDEKRLIAQREKWRDEERRVRASMPMFPKGENVDTYWLTQMEGLATDNYIKIAQRQGGKEEPKGDVFEYSIDVKNWEASLECLVKYLYALQSAEGAMYDVRSIDITARQGGVLRGTYVLTCAYMRGERAADEEDAEAGEESEKTEKTEAAEKTEATETAEKAESAPAKTPKGKGNSK